MSIALGFGGNAELKKQVEMLQLRVNDLENYLREISIEAGLPIDTIDIATCRHIAHQVKSIRNASMEFYDQLIASQAECRQQIKFLEDKLLDGVCNDKL